VPQPDCTPTRRQLRYLRQLAEQTGTTFTPPAAWQEASDAIDRLKKRSRSARFERQGDRRAVSRDLADQQPASSVRADEISGYGGNAHWTRR
jgi:hypothetical protein